jgi:flagellar assembly protein FliH
LPADATAVRSVFPPTAEKVSTEVAPALAQLPSPAADKLAAAEQAGFEKGYQAGHRDGYRAIVTRTEESFSRLAAAIEDVRSLRGGVLHRAEREAVHLALAIAEQVLHRAIAEDPTLLVELAKRAIDRLDNTLATIHLNPEDFAAVSAVGAPSLAAGIELTADANLPPGGCLVKSSFGVVDLAVSAQVKEIARTLLGHELEGDSGDGAPVAR